MFIQFISIYLLVVSIFTSSIPLLNMIIFCSVHRVPDCSLTIDKYHDNPQLTDVSQPARAWHFDEE